MSTKTWGRAKSDFNHAWLKNRLIVALGKARKVLEGGVQDDAIWHDLSALIAEWPARREEALRLLDDYPAALSPRTTVENSVGANISSESANWLADLADRRWSETEKPEERRSEAQEAVAEIDAQIEIMGALLPRIERQENVDTLPQALVQLQTAASCLAGAFSALGSSASRIAEHESTSSHCR